MGGEDKSGNGEQSVMAGDGKKRARTKGKNNNNRNRILGNHKGNRGRKKSQPGPYTRMRRMRRAYWNGMLKLIPDAASNVYACCCCCCCVGGGPIANCL
jgi:hypothetical protein